MKNIFGENLKKLMFEKALTQQQLSDILKIDQSRISRWKTGESIPSAKNLKRLSEILKVPVSALVNENKKDIEKLKDNGNLSNKVNLLEKHIKAMSSKIKILEEEINFLKKRN